MKNADPADRRRLELPAYTVTDVARYVHVPVATLRSWIQGRTYPVGGATKRSVPIIVPPSPRGPDPGLSFVNLIEAYVLGAIRRKYRISLQKVRRAILNLARLGEREHPLAHKHFKTNGIGLFVEHYGGYIEISRDLQLQLKEVLSTYLQRIDYEPDGSPLRLYPYSTPHQEEHEPATASRLIAISPLNAFGNPTIAGTGIRTFVIADRYLAGDSPDVIAEDYGRSREEIDAAIRWEFSCTRPAA